MPVVHYLNVKNGDCSIIQHGSGRVSVVDVCNARDPDSVDAKLQRLLGTSLFEKAASSGNFNQKAHPVNPIEYMNEHGINDVFRFILTGPDMDHMDGIKDFFAAFSPQNFWDTDNKKEMDSFEGSPYREEDWLFYKKLRDGEAGNPPKRLALLDGADGQFYTRNGDGSKSGDALYVLAPTSGLLAAAEQAEDYNDSSYVVLYHAGGGRVLFSGDSHDRTWDHLLATHKADIKDIDLLIAPHHGRKSGRSYKFLDVVKPKLTFFGNAPSQHLAYDAWNSRSLPYITNNQANCMVVDAGEAEMPVYVTNDAFARARNPLTSYSDTHRAWYLQDIK